ncbi:MAG: Uma2 family endonuclease [Cyanobacteria bacterium J06623_4]
MYSPEAPLPPSETLPTMYDLPSEDPEEPGLPDEFHLFQPQLLQETCQPPTYPQSQVFIGIDLNLYYDGRHPSWYKRPDWFVALDVERARRQTDLRWSYVVWQETVAPFLVVELLSPGTEADDLGQTLREVNQPPTKWQAYEQILRVPYYAIFDRYENQFRLFQLVGARYEERSLAGQYYWFKEIELGLGVWQGEYKGVSGAWLRWQYADQRWVPTDSEQAQAAQQEAQAAQRKAERLAARLRELGIDPETV